MAAQETDYAAGAATAAFPILYGTCLIGYLLASQPAPRYDAFGQPSPQMLADGIAYLVIATLLASLSHLAAFAVLQYRVLRNWRLRTLLLLQFLCVAGSLFVLRSSASVGHELLAVLIGPAFVTTVVYIVAALIARAERQSPFA